MISACFRARPCWPFWKQYSSGLPPPPPGGALSPGSSGTPLATSYPAPRLAAKVNRDMYLLSSTDQGATFRGAAVDQWKVDT